jgi:hypothetical protein
MASSTGAAFDTKRSATSNRIPSFFSPPSPTALKAHLQSLLDLKEYQLQTAGTLGQRILQQQADLEGLVSTIYRYEETGDEEGVKAKWKELGEAVVGWERANGKLGSGFGLEALSLTSQSQYHLVASSSSASSSTSIYASATGTASNPAGQSAASQSRRAKNAAHRADDVEFAFDIGSGLLSEVRRLQSLLGEKDKDIQDLKDEKHDLNAACDALSIALRDQETSAGELFLLEKIKKQNKKDDRFSWFLSLFF